MDVARRAICIGPEGPRGGVKQLRVSGCPHRVRHERALKGLLLYMPCIPFIPS